VEVKNDNTPANKENTVWYFMTQHFKLTYENYYIGIFRQNDNESVEIQL
jgi:hypothetical protein